MKTLLTLVFTLAAFISYGQDTTYFDLNHKKVKSSKEAYYFQIIQKSNSSKLNIVKTFFKSGKIKSEYSQNKKVNCYTEWYENGQLRRADTTNSKGELNGQVLSYWENGVLKRNDFFKKGKLLKGNCYDKDGKEIDHFDYKVMPSFPGGENMMRKFLGSKANYPNKCAEQGIQGTVLISFTVNPDGVLSNFKLENSVDPSLDSEALRVASLMPQWSPGLIEGEPVNTRHTIPIDFRLR